MDKTLKILNLEGKDPVFWGYQHGETFRDRIKELAQIRMERTLELSALKNKAAIFDIAQKHLGFLREYDQNLFKEFFALSKASKVSLEHLVVLNNYTDLRDIVPVGKSFQEEHSSGCSIIYSPHSSVLGQTWDMHGTAKDYVVLLKIDGGIWFTLTGCLGLAGINRHSVCVAINNLNSVDAQVGVLWPAIVRKALCVDSAKKAKDIIFNSRCGSGHHYAVSDQNNFFAIETSGRKKNITVENPKQNYFHTNHCLDETIGLNSYIRKGSNTLCRYRYLKNNFLDAQFKSAEEVFLALEGVSMDFNPSSPNATATCGTIVMDPKNKKVIACQDEPKKELLSCPQIVMNF